MKTIILFTTTLSLVANFYLSAQPGIEWQNALGGSGDEELTAITQTSDGGFILAGYANSNDGDVTGNIGGSDYWIVKLNNSGAIDWQKSYGGTNEDVAFSIEQTNDGGFIVAGCSTSNDGDVSGSHGGEDFWALKLTDTGALTWQKTFGGSANECAQSVQQTADGGYIIAGTSASNDGDVTGNHGESDYWVIKVTSAGDLTWQKSYGGSSFDLSEAIQQTTDGGYIVAGFTRSNDGDVSNNNGNYDYWVLKLDSSGAITWEKSFGGTSFDYGTAIQQTSDGGYVVAGITLSNDGDVTGNHGNADYWVLKLDAAGSLTWQKAMGGSELDYAYDIDQTADGGYVVTGYSYSNNFDVTGNHGSLDYWVVRMADTGSIEWQKCLGGANDDLAFGVKQTTDGGYIVGGYTTSNDGNVTGNHGAKDFWVVKLDPDGIGLNEISMSDMLNIYPNPTSETINVQMEDSAFGETQYTIFDFTGKVVLVGTTSKDAFQIDLGDLSLGIYIVQVRKMGNVARKSFVKR